MTDCEDFFSLFYHLLWIFFFPPSFPSLPLRIFFHYRFFSLLHLHFKVDKALESHTLVILVALVNIILAINWRFLVDLARSWQDHPITLIFIQFDQFLLNFIKLRLITQHLRILRTLDPARRRSCNTDPNPAWSIHMGIDRVCQQVYRSTSIVCYIRKSSMSSLSTSFTHSNIKFNAINICQ